MRIWTTTPKSIKRGSWCKCSNPRSIKAKQDFLNMLEVKGGDLMSQYVNNSTEVTIQCRTCHCMWNNTPESIKEGRWCTLCTNISTKPMQKFYDIVQEKNGTIIGTYVNTSRSIEIKCNTCNNSWHVRPNSVIHGSTWCPVCSGNCSKTAEKKFRDIVSSKNGRVLGKYTRSTDPTLVECGDCGKQWYITPGSVVNGGSWCAACAGVCPIKAKKDFFDVVSDKGGKVLGTYINNSTHILLRCGTCNNEWSTLPSSVKNGHWCPACVNTCPIKAMNKFMKILEERGGTLCSEYNGSVRHVTIECHKCHNKWSVEPHDVISHGNWCPHCRQSKGEYAIMSWLKKYTDTIWYQRQYKIPGDTHPYDFLIWYANKNMYYLIEFDGIQHFEKNKMFHSTYNTFIGRIKVDIYKNQLAQYNNIPLLRISYLELDYIDQWLEYFLTNPCSIMYSNQELYTKTYALVQNTTE